MCLYIIILIIITLIINVFYSAVIHKLYKYNKYLILPITERIIHYTIIYLQIFIRIGTMKVSSAYVVLVHYVISDSMF